MARSRTGQTTSTLGLGTEVTVHYVYTPGDPGRTYGPPEACYPPEGDELEITRVMLGDFDVTLLLADGDLEDLHERVQDDASDNYAEDMSDARAEYERDRWEDRADDARNIEFWEARL